MPSSWNMCPQRAQLALNEGMDEISSRYRFNAAYLVAAIVNLQNKYDLGVRANSGHTCR